MGYTLATSLQKPSDCNIGNEPFTAHGLLYIPQNLPPKFHHRAHETPPPVPNRSQINPFHAPNSTSLRASLILSSHRHLGLKWSLSLRLPHRNSVYTSPLLSIISATCPAHLILLGLIALKYLVKIHQKAPHYAVFCSHLLPRPSKGRVPPAAPRFPTPSAHNLMFF